MYIKDILLSFTIIPEIFSPASLSLKLFCNDNNNPNYALKKMMP